MIYEVKAFMDVRARDATDARLRAKAALDGIRHDAVLSANIEDGEPVDVTDEYPRNKRYG